MFFDECKLWCNKQPNDKTWANFKTHFLEAQRDLRLQQQTTQSAGFHAHYINQYQDENKENETATALANLATATAADRQAFTALVTTNTSLTNQLKEAHDEIK